MSACPAERGNVMVVYRTEQIGSKFAVIVQRNGEHSKPVGTFHTATAAFNAALRLAQLEPWPKKNRVSEARPRTLEIKSD